MKKLWRSLESSTSQIETRGRWIDRLYLLESLPYRFCEAEYRRRSCEEDDESATWREKTSESETAFLYIFNFGLSLISQTYIAHLPSPFNEIVPCYLSIIIRFFFRIWAFKVTMQRKARLCFHYSFYLIRPSGYSFTIS